MRLRRVSNENYYIWTTRKHRVTMCRLRQCGFPSAGYQSFTISARWILISFPTVNRFDPPPRISIPVKHNGPGVPDDTMLFTFDNVPMDADDVSMALLAAAQLACTRLSSVSGRDRDPVGESFRVKDSWFRFELGWDLHSDQPFLLSELKVILIKLYEVGQRYNMRQATFTYYLKGRFHVVGRLRNPAVPPPPRRMAVGPKQMAIPDGSLVWSDYGRPMAYEPVVDSMMAIMLNGWDSMVDSRKSSDKIRSQNVPFVFRDPKIFLRFEVSGPPDKLVLEDLLQIAYYTAEFGRIFNSEEHHCKLTNTYYPAPKVISSILSKDPD
ncbi:MAG: hypothetical protein Q9222_001003 [Ikaeria aurantiellina]